MGANHARVLRMIPDVEVKVVVDPDSARAKALASPLAARVASSADDAVGNVDAAVLAVPTNLHANIGLMLLDAGIHLLVEKPLASDVPSCTALVEKAERQGCLLMVGHVERFNPAALELGNLISDPRHLSFERLGPRPERVEDDVVLDLMIHDLDLASCLVGSEVSDVYAVGSSENGKGCQIASALIRFQNGAIATLIASHLGQNKIRRVTVTQPGSFVMVDLVKQDISVNRVVHTEFVSERGAMYRQQGITEIPFLEHRGEPLMLELRHFIDSVAGGTQPSPSGRDGLAAVRLALDVRNAIAQTRPHLSDLDVSEDER